MATQSAIFIPEAGNGQTASLAAATSTGELVIGTNRIFAVNATDDVNIKFGNSGMAAASAADFRIPANTVATFDLGSYTDRVRLFNNTAASVTYWILMLSRA